MGVKANEEVGATGIPDRPRQHARATRVEPKVGSCRKGLAPVVLTQARARTGSRFMRCCVRPDYGNDWFSLVLMGRFVFRHQRVRCDKEGCTSAHNCAVCGAKGMGLDWCTCPRQQR